jgi:hypothetical protein
LPHQSRVVSVHCRAKKIMIAAMAIAEEKEAERT